MFFIGQKNLKSLIYNNLESLTLIGKNQGLYRSLLNKVFNNKDIVILCTSDNKLSNNLKLKMLISQEKFCSYIGVAGNLISQQKKKNFSFEII